MKIAALMLWLAATLFAQEGWVVMGTVRSDSGPLRNVSVRIRGPQPSTARTDAQGRFTLRGHVPGTYSVSIQKPEDAGLPRSRTLRLAPGRKVENLDLVVPRGGVISGRVTERTGRPVSGLVLIAYEEVKQWGIVRFNQVSGGVTDDQGRYRVPFLPDGEYLVVAAPGVRRPLRPRGRRSDPEGPLPASFPSVTFFPNTREAGAASRIEITGGGQRDGIDIVMEKEPGYCLSFRTGPAPAGDGKVEMGAEISQWLGARGGPSAGGGSITAGGEAQFCGLPPGEYRLLVGAYQLKPLKRLGQALVPVVIGNRHVDVGLVPLTPPRELTGRVTVRGLKPGEPVPEGMTVELVMRNHNSWFGTTPRGPVGGDGVFALVANPDDYGLRIHGLPAGAYVAGMRQDGRDAAVAGASPDGGVVDVVIHPDGARLSGRVLSRDREPVPVAEATVFLSPRRGGGETLVAQTDEEGVYSFDSHVPPGEYHLAAVTNLPESQRQDERAAERFRSAATTIQLGAGESKVEDLRVQTRGGA